MARRCDSWVALLRSYPESDKLAACSFGAEALYVRLVALVGDDGLYPGHPGELLWPCFGPRARAGAVTAADVAVWLDELEAVELIRRYEADGRPMLAVLKLARLVRKDRWRASGLPAPEWQLPIESGADGGLIVVNAAPPRRHDGASKEPGCRGGVRPSGSVIPPASADAMIVSAAPQTALGAESAVAAHSGAVGLVGATLAPPRRRVCATLEPRARVSDFQTSNLPDVQSGGSTPTPRGDARAAPPAAEPIAVETLSTSKRRRSSGRSAPSEPNAKAKRVADLIDALSSFPQLAELEGVRREWAEAIREQAERGRTPTLRRAGAILHAALDLLGVAGGSERIERGLREWYRTDRASPEFTYEERGNGRTLQTERGAGSRDRGGIEEERREIRLA